MGIHFVCHHCSYALHVKDFQAGKRGKCPNCRGSFRIPANDSSYSTALEDASEDSALTNVRNAFKQANQIVGVTPDQSSSDSVAIAMEQDPVTKKSVPSESKKTKATSSKTSVAKTIETVAKVEIVPPEAAVGSPMMPAALSEASDAKWFVRPPSGGQFGPAPSQLLMAWITESRVTAESYLWREGFAEWQTAGELVPELFPSAKGPLLEPQILTDILSEPPPNSVQNVADFNSDSASATHAALVVKKQMQKRRQQLTMIIILAVVSLILFGILIFVLVFQATKSPQPLQSHIPKQFVTRNSEAMTGELALVSKMS
jgi:GYF domain 2